MTEFPKGDDFYIKAVNPPPGHSSTQNSVVDVDRGFFVSWGAVKEGSKVIIAQQKSTTEHDGYQLWRYDDGFLINKQTTLYLEPESVKATSKLVLHHRKSGSKAANQKWTLTEEGHIKLKDKPYVLEAKDKQIVLLDASKASKATRFIILPLHPVKKNDAAIGVVRLELVCAKGLKGVDSFLAGGKSDPYVRVFHSGNNKDIIAQTKVIDNDLNPVWNEVHYLPVRYIGEKFILDVMDFNTFIKDKPLGNCTLDITGELVKEVSEGCYEGTANGIDVWAKLTIQGQIHYKAKFFPLEPLPKPTPDFLANLKEKPFDRAAFYVLITLQAPNGGFPPSDTLANLFGFESQDQLLELYKKQCREDRILKINQTVWTTSMILWFLRFLLKEYRSEWGGIYERAEQFISKEINDLEIEEIVVATGRKGVRDRFDIGEPDSKTKRITRETITITHVRRILKCQHNSGPYPFTDDLAKSFGYESAEKLQTAFYEYRNSKSKSQKVSQMNPQVWSTMMVIYFYRYVAVDQKKEWFSTYERSYRWLWAQLKGNESLETECFDIVKSFIKEYHGVRDDVVEMDRAFEKEISVMVESIKHPQKDRGIVQKPYGIARIEIISAKNLRQADSWLAGSASDPYVKISNLATSWVYGDSRVIYNNCDPVWEQVFYIPVYDVHEKFNLQVFDYNAFFKHKLLGFYILDLKNIIKELPNGSYEGKKLKLDANLTYKGSNRGQLSFVADFFSLPESEEGEILNINNVSIRHLYLLMTYQSQYGCFELTDSLARLFNFSSKEELINAFSDFVQKDEAVRNLDHKIWATVLVTSFLKVLLWKDRREWVNIYNRAESWLSENVVDVEVEERLYNYANKFVIKHFNVTQWVDENQQRSLGLLVTSKRTIITRRYVDTRIVRRFLTYQNESGCFELTPQLAEALGFSSVDEAKKHIETHFSSHSPRTGQLNANVWSTAIMLWFIRYVLVDFRNDWVNEYQKAHDWICQQVPDEKVREELLEAARNFVVKRFEVQHDAINEDESFKESIEVKDRFQSQGQDTREIVNEPDPEEEAPIPNDEVVGIIRILVKDAKNLKKSDSWFTFSNPDPYVRIVDSAGNEIVRTQANHGTINPKWNEVHLISAHGLGENISFEIYDENLFISDQPCGTYVLDTNILLKSEDQSKPCVGQFPLQIGKKPVRGHLNLEVQFFATGFNESENFVFSKDTIKQQHLYMLISWRNANGSFEFTDKLARFFNYKSVDELKENFLAHLSSDKDLLKYDLSVLATALTIMYLKILCWKHYGEWKRLVANSETWLSKEINNVDAEDRLYNLCKTFIIERFKVKNLEKEQLEIIEPAKVTIINRKIITIRHVRTLLSHQSDDGCVVLNEKVAEYFGFKSVDECLQHLRKHFNKTRVSKLHQNAWTTACVVWYLRLVAVDHRHEWIANYEKSSEWLKKQCNGDAALEKEINECARRFVVSRYEVDKDAIEADNSFVAAIKTKDVAIEEEKNDLKRQKKGSMHRKTISLSGTIVNRNTTTEPIVKKFLTYRTNDGCYQLNDEIAKHLGFLDKVSLEAALRSHFISDNLSKLDTDTLFTAVATWYLRLVAVDHRPHWATDCDTSYKWLSSKIKNPQIERELLGSAKKFVIRGYRVDDDALEKDEEYQDHLNRTLDVESAKTIVIDNSDKSFAEAIDKTVGGLKEGVKKVVEGAKEGAKEVTRDVVDIAKGGTDDIVGGTKAATENVKHFIGDIYKAATKLGDKVEDALTFDKDKIDDHEKAEALIIVEESATPEKCKDIVSNQKDDGSIELSDTICNELDVPKEEIIKTIQKKTKNNKLKSPDFSSSIATAVCTAYLNKAAPKHKNVWKDKCDKARGHISNQIGDADAEKELLELADDYVVENCIKKVIKDKKRNAVAKVRESTTPEKCNDIVSNQKDDGSFEVSETICKEIDVPVTEVVTKVKKGTQNKKLKSPESESWWKTALNLSYLKVAAPHHKKDWEDKEKKAREYLSKQIGDTATEKALLDCTDKFIVDNVTKKFDKDHKKEVAITIVQDTASPEKSEKIVSKQKDDGSIELDDSVCKEFDAPKEEIITTVRKKINNKKLQLPQFSTSLETAVNIAYLKNAASKHKGDWEDKYNKAREYLAKQIGDKDTEEELIKCADEYVVDKVTDKVIEEKKTEVIELKKDEIPKDGKGRGFFGGLYDTGAKVVDTIKNAFTYDKNKIDDHEKAEALIIVEESATPEKCQEITSKQKDDGCIELDETVCNELDAPKEEIITTIQKNIKNTKLKSPEFSPCLETAINIAYLKKAAPKHEGLWKDKYNKAREYLSKKIGDANAEKELLECADNYVIDNSIKKVIKDKKKNAVVKLRDSTTPEKCNDVVSKQKDDGSFEVSETICKEIDIPVDVVPVVKKETQNEKLKSPKSEPWWKTALALSYLKIAAPDHKKQWEDKEKKAREYLSKEIGDAKTVKELLDCTDKYVVDSVAKKVEKDHKKDVAITIVQDAASPDKCQEIVSKQKDDGSIELDDSVCNELDTPKEEIITTIKKKVKNTKLKSPDLSTSLATAINLAYLKNAASKYEDDWQDKYKKARDYLSKQIGDKNAEDELIKCADEYVVDKVTDKVIEEKKQTVINLKEDEIPKTEKPKGFFGGIYEQAAKLGDQIENAITFDKNKHGNHEKAEALIVVEESATPEKCKEIVSHQNEDGSIELIDTVCHDLDVPKEEIITTIQKKTTHDKLKIAPVSAWETAISLSYLKKAAPKHEGLWRDKYNKACEYLSNKIGDKDAEKELLDCADNYVVENSTKKVIKDKKRNSVAKVRDSTTPEKCNEAVSNQKDDGSFEISETVCKEIDVPVEKVVTEVKKDTKNEKLKSRESEPWWKTGLTLSYLNVAAPHHKKQWEDKDKKAREYLSDQIKDTPTEKELLDCTDKYVVDKVTKKVEKDHKKDKAITIVQDAASPKKSQEIVSKQKDNGCIELDDSVCDELGAPKEDIITTIKKKITNTKLKTPEFSTSLETAINLSYLKNAASKYEGDWRDKYNKAREYLSNQIGDKKAEEELIECADEYVIDKVTDKVIEKKKQDAIELKKDEIPNVKNFFGGLYEKAAKFGDQIEKAITFDNDKHDDHEKAEALIIVEESATPEKCKEITSKQKRDGSIELGDSVCNDLDAPKEEIITTIQKKITNDKLKSPKVVSTAVNLSYLKKAAPKHESLWKDKYDNAREYLSKLIGDKNAEKELLDCTDNYVVENSTKKVIKDKKRNAVAKLRDSATPEKCNEAVSNQKDDGSFEISETVCKEIDVPVEKVVTEVKKDTRNEKLKSPESEPWWKTALTLGYIKAAAPDHKKLWEDKDKKAREYLSDQIKDAATEKELLDCADKYVVDNVAKKVEKDHKKSVAITIVQDAASPDKCKEIVSKQKDDGSIELDDSVCNELGAPKEDVITTIKKKITNEKLKSPEHSTSLATAINLSYLKNAASKYKGDWEDKYNKAREYLSNQIGDKKAEEELIECADEYVVDKVTDKVIKEKERDVIDLKKDEIPKKSVKNFFGDLYETAAKLGNQIENAITFDKNKHGNHEKAEALIIVEESATPENCKEITSNQKDNGSIELNDSVCNDLDTPKEEIIPTIQKKITNDKLKSPELISTAVNLSYLKKAAPKHESLWKDKYNKARNYLSKQIGDANAEKELLVCADNYVIENCTKKVITDKKKNAVVTVQDSTTPEKCNDAVSHQKDDGSFEINDTVCKAIEVPIVDVVPTAKKYAQNKKLKSPNSEPWWKTALTLSYLKVAAPHHKKLWEDKEKKAREYLSKQIGDAEAERELLDCTNKYIVDNVTKKVDKDHKEASPITIVQESALPDAKSGEDKRYITQKYNFTPEDLLKLIAKK